VTALKQHLAAHADKWSTSQTFDLEFAISTLQIALDEQRPKLHDTHRVEFMPVMELRSAFGEWRFSKCHIAHCSVCGGSGWRESHTHLHQCSPVIGQCDNAALWTRKALEQRQFIIARLQRSIKYARALGDKESIPVNQFALDSITEVTNRHCIKPITPQKLKINAKYDNLAKQAMSRSRKRPACAMPKHLTTLGLEAAVGTSTATSSSSSVAVSPHGVVTGSGIRPACVIAYTRP
jgi:hypothetical protein